MSTPGFIFGGDTGIHSPEELARARAYAEALLGPQRPAQNVGEGLAVLGQAIRGRREMNAVNKASAAGDASASSAIAQALGGGGSFPPAPVGGASPVASALSGGASSGPPSDVEAYIRQAAQARGIDPDIAVKVAQSEGGLKDPVRRSDYAKGGNREPSYGPYQLLVGGGQSGFPEGMGNQALAAGIDPRDPANWQKGVDFALDGAKKNGWGAWYGAKAAGITGMQGIGQSPVAAAPAPQQVASLDPAVGMPAAPSPVSAALQLPAQGPIPQDRPYVMAALNGAPAPGAVGGPEATTPAGQRVLGQMMSPLPMGGQSMQMQPPAGGAPAPAPAPAPAAQAQPNLDQIPVEAGGNGGAIQPGALPNVQQLMQAAQNPWLKPEQRQLINNLLQQQMQNQDPLRQLQIKAAEKSLAVPPKQWQKLDDNTLFDPASGETKQIGAGGPTEFKGTALDAQAWNILQTAAPDSKEYATAYSIVSQPKTQLVQTENGMMPVEVPPQLPGWLKAPGAAPAGGVSAQPAAPAAAQPGADAGVIPGTKKPPTEMQARNGAIGKILLNEVPTLGKTFGALADPKGQLLNAIPGGLGNAWQSEDYQRAAASVKTSIANVLYSLSGASSNPGEVLKQIEVLTPAFGDKPGTISDKLNRFKTYVRSVSSEANDPELTKSVEDALKQMEGTAEAPQKDIKDMSDDELKAIINGN